MSADAQLALDVEPERAYVCCGAPCGPMSRPSGSMQFPHREGCANPMIGRWMDRFGRPLRLLWCSDTARLGGACPYTGGLPAAFAASGGCCKDIVALNTAGVLVVAR